MTVDTPRGPSESTIRVACHARVASFAAPVDETLRTLERIESAGVIDEVTLDAWPAEVPFAAGGSPQSDVVARFETFAAWADQWDVHIQPPFAVETRSSEITGETREILVTPVQCLAIYVDGALQEVFPHTVERAGERETYTVRDALALLEAHGNRPFDAGHSPDTPPGQRVSAGPAGIESE